MKVTLLTPDQAVDPAPAQTSFDAGAFAKSVDVVADALLRADRAEDAFAAHRGSLQDAVFERAQADVTLSVATGSAQRGAQALQSILNMQV